MAGTLNSIAGRTFAARYAVEREVGRGGTAIVYLARDLSHGRMVAIKTLREVLMEGLSAERFLREIRLTAALHHPHIVPLLDSGEAEGVLYCVMPYMDGGSLRDRLRQEKQLPLDEVVAIGRTICSALESAHAKGLIHRDVKPENILFTGGQPCLADFGIARALVHGTGESTTSTGIVRGTPAYMSPEQASGEHEYDGRSDIYSLGCVLYEAIAGMQAFVGPTQQSVLAQRMMHPPRPLHMYRPAVPSALAEVIGRAMMVTAADRYQTAAELAAALAAAEPDLAKASSTSHALPAATPDTPVTRRRWAIGATLGVIGVAAALTYALNARPVDVDENRLVVAPFNVLDPADTLWRIGLVDVFSRSFDGAGPIRTVPPTVSMRKWKAASADVATATQLGRDVNAGLALFGQLMRVGRDSARLTVSLVDLIGHHTFELEARDEAVRVDRLADSLTVRLLRELGSVRPIAAVSRASIGSSSFPALKAFLQGEQLYRSNDFTAARDAYTRAISFDTGFALAYRRMRGVWRVIAGQESDSTGFAFARKAGERNHGLGPRDSLLIVADSLAAAKAPGTAFLDNVGVGRLRRRIHALETAMRRYPDDPEVQFEYGEAAYHIGERVGLSQRRALDAFLESIRLDPPFLPSYYHAIELVLPLDGVAAAVRLANQYDAMNPRLRRYRLFVQLLETRREQDLAGLIASMNALPVSEVVEAIELTRRWPDSLDTSVRLSQRLLGHPNLSHADSTTARFWLASTLMFRGRLGEARATLTPEIIRDHPEYFFQLAALGAVPTDSALRVGRRWSERVDERGLYLGIPLLAAAGDTLSLKNLIRHFQQQLAPDQSSVAQPTASVGVASAGARLALARHDTATALREFLAVPDSLCSWWCAGDRLMTAQLLRTRGRQREALDYLDRHPPGGGPTTIAETLWLLERSAAATGSNTGDAERDMRFVRMAWSRADSTLREMLRKRLPGQSH